jgi:type II secretory pathway pseudopilin PulG
MSRGVPGGARNDSGFSIVVLLASITIMLVVMGAAVPTWKYIMKNDREEELYFRGDQIARGIERYQRKNGNTLPVSLELMVKGRYLRKVYKDPMTKDGKWRIIHPGEALLPGGAPGRGTPGGARPGSSPRPGATPQPGFPGLPGSGRPGGGGPTQGAILGVVSTSKDESLKLMNGRTRYDQWIFLAGQPRILGGAQATPNVLPGGLGPSPSPGTRPSPLARP